MSKEKYEKNEIIFKKKDEGQLSILGTFGATAPFIGLLGTVFGIIVAFGFYIMSFHKEAKVYFETKEYINLKYQI